MLPPASRSVASRTSRLEVLRLARSCCAVDRRQVQVGLPSPRFVPRQQSRPAPRSNCAVRARLPKPFVGQHRRGRLVAELQIGTQVMPRQAAICPPSARRATGMGDVDDIQPIVQILAKSAFTNQLRQIRIGRAQYPRPRNFAFRLEPQHLELPGFPSTRSSLTWPAKGRFCRISSRNKVPPSASSNRPDARLAGAG